MTKQEVYRLVYDYIGVQDGYLVGYTYRKHEEFYPRFCNLNIDPLKLPGTTRERFLHILEKATGEDQAKIVRGVLAFLPPSQFAPEDREEKNELAAEFKALASRLENSSTVATPTLSTTSEVVERAIADAEELIKRTGATSGVDRIHTALHGYLKAVCSREGMAVTGDSGLTHLFKLLRQQHPRLQLAGPRQQDVDSIFKAIANVMDSLNPIRNQASVAHPNPALLGEEEAMFVINATRTVLHYLNAKFK